MIKAYLCHLVVFGVITDLLYSLSPVYFLWNVKIKTKTKITILALTGSGLLYVRLHWDGSSLTSDQPLCSVTVTAVLDIVFVREFLSTEDATCTSDKS